jgi:hypothetical protein
MRTVSDDVVITSCGYTCGHQGRALLLNVLVPLIRLTNGYCWIKIETCIKLYNYFVLCVCWIENTRVKVMKDTATASCLNLMLNLNKLHKLREIILAR